VTKNEMTFTKFMVINGSQDRIKNVHCKNCNYEKVRGLLNFSLNNNEKNLRKK